MTTVAGVTYFVASVAVVVVCMRFVATGRLDLSDSVDGRAWLEPLIPIFGQKWPDFCPISRKVGQVSLEGNRETGRAGSYRNQTGTGQICPISRKWEGSLSRNRTKWGGFCLILGK